MTFCRGVLRVLNPLTESGVQLLSGSGCDILAVTTRAPELQITASPLSPQNLVVEHWPTQNTFCGCHDV